jgi:hypothetical protein
MPIDRQSARKSAIMRGRRKAFAVDEIPVFFEPHQVAVFRLVEIPVARHVVLPAFKAQDEMFGIESHHVQFFEDSAGRQCAGTTGSGFRRGGLS